MKKNQHTDAKKANSNLKDLNGDSSIRYKTDKLLEGRVMVEGKIVSVYVKARCLGDKEAEEKAKKQLKKAITHAKLTGVVESKMSLQDRMKKWVEMRNNNNKLRAKTYGDYLNLIRTQIFGTQIGRTEISKLTVMALEEFFLHKLKYGRILQKTKTPSKVPADTSLSLGTITKMLVLIRATLNDALKNDEISRNVARLVELPDAEVELNEFGEVVDRESYSAFSPEERIVFLSKAKKSELYLIFLVLFYTGMRIGEVLALKWRNVDLEKGVIYVRESIQRVKTPNGPQKTALVLGPPKTFAGRKTIPLRNIVIKEFIKYREKQMETKGKWGEAYQDKDIVFCIENGNYREPRNFTRSYYNIRNNSGVSPINLHGIRHTFASMLLEKKVHVKIVSILLGHSDVSLAINTYSHVFPEIRAVAIEVLDDYTIAKIMDDFNISTTCN